MNEWISVKDSLPFPRFSGEVWNYVIVCADGIVAPAVYYFDRGWRTVSHDVLVGNVTDWMPLPDPPKESTDAD